MKDTFTYTRAEIDAIQQTAFDTGFELGKKIGSQDAKFLERREEVKRVLENLKEVNQCTNPL